MLELFRAYFPIWMQTDREFCHFIFDWCINLGCLDWCMPVGLYCTWAFASLCMHAHMCVCLCVHVCTWMWICACMSECTCMHVHHIILHRNRYCCFIFPTLPGLMPYNFICVRTGVMLSEIRSLDDAFTWYTMLQLLVLAVVALVPGLVIKRLQTRRQEAKAKTQW